MKILLHLPILLMQSFTYYVTMLKLMKKLHGRRKMNESKTNAEDAFLMALCILKHM